MNIQDVKTSIENKTINDDLIIFRYEDVPFVANQYINEIANIKNKKLIYIDNLSELNQDVFDIFNVNDNSDIKIYKCDNLEELGYNIKSQKNLYIITHKVDKDIITEYNDFILDIPKLEGWHLKDYVYSVAEGVDYKELDWLIDICNSDIYRIENELDKFRLFDVNERKYLLDDMKYQGAFSDLSCFNVFNITNAVINKDMVMLKNSLEEIKNFDAEPLGVITLLYQGFRKLIQVLLAKNPTPENTGLKSSMIYAISKNRNYTKRQMLNNFLFLTNIDKMLKTGKIEIKWLIDYAVCKVLTT